MSGTLYQLGAVKGRRFLDNNDSSSSCTGGRVGVEEATDERRIGERGSFDEGGLEVCERRPYVLSVFDIFSLG